MKKILYLILVSLLVLGLVVVGCTTPPAEQEEEEEIPCNPDAARSVLCNAAGYPEDPNACIVEGNTLKILHPDAPGNLGCPWEFSSGFETPQARFAIERLIGLDENGELCPQLATAWVNDPEDSSITFTIREGVKFHDGSDLNAEVVKWNIELQAGLILGQRGVRDIAGIVTSVEETGPYEVKVYLDPWVEDFDRFFMSTSAGRIISMESALANNNFERGPDTNQWCKENPIGTGPFKFVSYDGSTLLKWEKFDDYWQEGLPYLDAVEIHYVPNEMTRLFAFQSGEYHVMNDMTTSTAKELLNAGYTVLSRVVNIEGLGPDSKEGVFADQEMREMLAMAVDYETLVDSQLNGLMEYTNQLALESVELAGLSSGYNSGIVGYPYDQEAAKAILEAHGYNTNPINAEGYPPPPPNPNPLNVDMVYATQAATDFYLAVQSAFWEIGVDLDLQYMERGPWSSLCSNGWDGLVEYQFSYNCFELSYPEALTMGMNQNMDKYASIDIPDEFQDVYDTMLGTPSGAGRDLLYKQLNKMVIDDYCLVVPCFGFEIMSGRQPTVHDFGYGIAASEWTPEMGWLEEAQ